MVQKEDPVTEKLENGHCFNEEIKFEDILEEIGSNGMFQKRMNAIFICLAIFFQAMSSYSKMIALTVPDHWCHVPGWKNTTLSLEMWKNVTIPRYNGAYSRCEMYESPGESNATIPCIYGWDYDSTWFSVTVVSQENWVCDKEMYPNTVYSVSHFVAIGCGVLLLYSGDRFGRRKQFLLSTGMVAVSQSLLPASSTVILLYTALSALSESAGLTCIESSLAAGIELSDVKHRSYINFLSFLSHCLGTIASALAAWVLRNWNSFVLISAIPCFVPLLLNCYFPDSPRWLLSRGRPEEAHKVLKRIAATNGRTLPDDTWEKLKIMCDRRTPNMGIKSIVADRNLFKNTAILVICRSTTCLAIFTLLFSNKSFGENPFISYICQGFLQMAAVFAAHHFGNRFGRRISHCLTLCTASAICIVTVVVITASSPEWTLIAGSLMLQFLCNSSISFTNLQSMEIHPTCIRQFGIAIEFVGVQCFVSMAPYFSYLGNVHGMEYMFGILAAVLLITAVLMSFVPESLNEKLPETLEDASLYGRNQKYWSLPRREPAKGETVTQHKYDA